MDRYFGSNFDGLNIKEGTSYFYAQIIFLGLNWVSTTGRLPWFIAQMLHGTGTFTYISLECGNFSPIVGKYTIHGASGLCF